MGMMDGYGMSSGMWILGFIFWILILVGPQGRIRRKKERADMKKQY